MVKFCTNCGEKNSIKSRYCGSCGTLLDSPIFNEKTASRESVETRGNRNSKQHPPKKQGKKKRSEAHKTGPVESSGRKEIPLVKIGYFVLFLSIVALVLLFSSRTFESPKQTGNITQAPNDHNHSSANMANLEEIRKMEETVRNNPQDYSSMLHLAHLYNDSGFYQKAIDQYKLYLNIQPRQVDVWIDLGVCYYNLKDYKNALLNMEKGLSIEPRHQIGNFNLGIVNFAQNNIAEAKSWWQKSIEIDPTTDIAKRAKELIESN